MKIYVTKINEIKLWKESLLFLIFIDIRINYLLNISIHEKHFLPLIKTVFKLKLNRKIQY